MSNFSNERLYELYTEYLPVFTRLAQISEKEGVDLKVRVEANGIINFESVDWATTKSGKKVLREHYIRQGRGEVADGSITHTFDD